MNRDDIEIIRRRNYFAERDIPCPQCSQNLRDVKDERCPGCGFELRIEHGEFVGTERTEAKLQLLGVSIAFSTGLATFAALVAPVMLWPQGSTWFPCLHVIVAFLIASFAGYWFAERAEQSEWVRWNILNPASSVGLFLRLLMWVIVVALIARVVLGVLSRVL